MQMNCSYGERLVPILKEMKTKSVKKIDQYPRNESAKVSA